MRSQVIRRAALLGLAVAGMAAANGAAAQTLPPARQVLDRYVEAVGGKAVMQRHQGRHMVAEMAMPAMGMTMEMQMWQARPDKMVSTTTMPGLGEVRTGYDGEVGWSIVPMQGPRLLSDAELRQTARQADFDAGADPAKNFASVETIERSEVQGRPCWVVRMTAEAGEVVDSCFDVESGLLLGSTSKQVSSMGEVEVVVRFEDYRDFDGLKMPTRTVSQMMGQEMVMTIKEVSHAPVDPSVFELPAEVRALTGAQ